VRILCTPNKRDQFLRRNVRGEGSQMATTAPLTKSCVKPVEVVRPDSAEYFPDPQPRGRYRRVRQNIPVPHVIITDHLLLWVDNREAIHTSFQGRIRMDHDHVNAREEKHWVRSRGLTSHGRSEAIDERNHGSAAKRLDTYVIPVYKVV
jgi:hypothetical protein